MCVYIVCILCVFINGVGYVCISCVYCVYLLTGWCMCVYCVYIVCMWWFQHYFEELVRFMSSGPSHILVLSRAGPGPADVVQAWLDFMGPADVEEAKRDKPHRLLFHLPGGPLRPECIIITMTICSIHMSSCRSTLQ